MAIADFDQYVNALTNNFTRINVDKFITLNVAINQIFSTWNLQGQPVAGAIPTTPVACSSATFGSISIPNQTLPTKSYLGLVDVGSTAINTFILMDRLAHMGGLNGTLTTAQTVGLNLDSFLGTGNIDQRKGDANYSDVEWYLEWYADTGATASNATINVTYNDGTTANIGTTIAVGGTVRRGRMIDIRPLSTTAPTVANRYIMRVNSVTLSASTGAVGNFGITAARTRCIALSQISHSSHNWSDLGIPEIYNDSCLFGTYLCNSTTTINPKMAAKVLHG